MSKLIFYILYKLTNQVKFSNISYKLFKFTSKFLNLLLRLFKSKKSQILENSFKLNTYFEKIFHEFDDYIDHFITILNSNPLFPFSFEKEKVIIKDLSNNEFLEFKEQLIQKANKILENKLQILGKNVNFNKSIDWFYSFYENYKWPLINTNKLKKIIDKQKIDVKYSLRLNYHEEFVILGLAYYLTKNEIYVTKFEKLILSWIRANPPNFGINWLDLLEISHRVINWIFSLYFFSESQFLNRDTLKLIGKALYQQIYYIKLHSNPYSYNHTIGEYFAIFLFSKIFKDFGSIKKWYKKSFQVLNKQITRQIQEDGVHFEQSTHYHRLVLEILILFLIIEPKARSNNNLALIKKMFIFLKYITKPDGILPQIGDSDNSHFIPEILLHQENRLNYVLLNLGAAFFEDSELKATEVNLETFIILFLLGSQKSIKFKELNKINEKNKIKYFDKSGYLICKNEQSNSANYLFFDMGNFGSYPSSHDHSDISNIVYSIDGNPILIDSGTYKYNIPHIFRNLFRSGKAHNILTINNYNQAKIIDKWTWINIPKLTRKFIYFQNDIKASISHDAYKNCVSERKIKTSKDLNNLIIIDKIYPIKIAKSNQIIKSYFHFPSNTKLEILNNTIKINQNVVLSVKCEDLLLKINKKSFPLSPFYGIMKKSILIEFVLNVTFKNIEPIKVYYHFHKIEKKITLYIN